MTSAIQRRLEQLESSTGTGEEKIRVEHYDLSETGDLIRLPHPYGLADDGRPATKTVQVVMVDSDNGRPGPRYLAYLRRMRASGA